MGMELDLDRFRHFTWFRGKKANNKHTRQVIESQKEQVKENTRRVQEDLARGDSPHHHLQELEAALKKIRRLQKRLPGG